MYKTCLLYTVTFILLFLISYHANAQQKEISSPNGKISVTFQADTNFGFAVRLNNKPAFAISDASLVIRDHEMGKVSSVKSRSVNETQKPLIREKRAIVTDRFNEITVNTNQNPGSYSGYTMMELPTAILPVLVRIRLWF